MKTDDATRFCWIQDLEKARNVPARDRKGYEMLLSWFGTWRLGRQLPPGRESARLFWKQQILPKLRAEWQMEQWKAPFGWNFEWLRFMVDQGRQPLTLEERVFRAMDSARGRRGLDAAHPGDLFLLWRMGRDTGFQPVRPTGFQAVVSRGSHPLRSNSTKWNYGRRAMRFARWTGVDREKLKQERAGDF